MSCLAEFYCTILFVKSVKGEAKRLQRNAYSAAGIVEEKIEDFFFFFFLRVGRGLRYVFVTTVCVVHLFLAVRILAEERITMSPRSQRPNSLSSGIIHARGNFAGITSMETECERAAKKEKKPT